MANQVVLVTGASAGIGKATAKTLLAEGYTVYVAARRVGKMKDLEELGVIAIQMDITKETEVAAAVEQITAENNGVDILVNNAGFGLYGAMEDISIDEARYQFEVNLFGLARLTQLVLPYMRSQKSGKIINISSIGGKIYTPLGSWYYATKHALEGWSDCLRFELKAFNIDVVIIEPGLIQTEFGNVMIAPMMRRSGRGVYGNLAKTLARSSIDMYANNSASKPQVVADLILKAIKAKKPKTRYVGGKLATPLLFARKWGGDRLFDWLIGNMLK
ncbi:Estradiol 17-beta-dehydrogenase [[Leptolyngbya] sp. PCC 7376]|uniref:oxidoreductase n=1 Tax=[Leptolyngbya] sp. PCC 7376 TaxID=111781 RepID=UPI00029F0571|nr:oxidoreductase [[Leptolyngbya] sp. PCC 7376]AFY38156.1 Estradiol 17-beta-dehydrogenase [[Leptolyngbya] sp. PCC 7376]